MWYPNCDGTRPLTSPGESATGIPAEPAQNAPVITPVIPILEVPEPDDSPESLLEALSSLESEILGDSSGDSYDVDKLLGEYGFECSNEPNKCDDK